MKDKEKQIKEMAKIIYETDCAVESCEYVSECIKKGIPFSRINTQLFINTKQAESLYEQGYRKLPQDSVVLSREEFEKLKDDNKYFREMINKFRKDNTDIRKETAEKIILPEIKVCKELYDLCNDQNNEYRKGFKNCCRIIQIRLNDLAKQFGVEIKE